jgi:outer membrane protein TolC
MMTLAEALAYANAHQPEIKQSLAQLAARQAEAKIPRSGWLPRANMQAQWLVGTNNNTTASFMNVAGVEVPRIAGTPASPDTSWTPYPSAIVAVTAMQQLYEFGRIAAQSALADALTDVARASAVTVQLDIGLRVEETYNAVLAAKHILSASQEAYRRADALYRMAETGVRTGLRPPIDRTRAQAELAQADVQRTRAETGLTSAQAALAAVIGSPELLIDAAEIKPQERPFPGLEEALRIAEEHSPEVLAALARLRAQESETSSLTRELLPNTYLAASVWGNAGGAPVNNVDPALGNGWLASVGNYSVSLVLSWHLVDPTTITRRSASRQRQQVERAAVEVARRGVVLQVERSYVDLVAAQKTLPGLLATVTASRANLDQAQARFKAGLGTIIDVTDAENLLVNAELNLAVGQFNVARAAAQLARSLGTAPTP